MNLQFYLVINDRGNTKTVINMPYLKRDEIFIKMNIAIPDTLFTRPQFETNIAIPTSDIPDVLTEIMLKIPSKLNDENELPD